ncbi:MAG: helix-turn-helix domain-containing protein [Bdellovibrionales bacterium]
MALAEFLRKKREELGHTQKEVSDSLGYTSPQFVSNWERGVSAPPLSCLAKLVDLYKLNPKELIDILMREQEALLKSTLIKKRKRA